MKIVINESYLEPVIEEYSQYDEDDVNSILADVCKIIDKNKIARFSVLFSAWDERFKNVDFSYDFTSIAPELDSLSMFLGSKVGCFSLLFYEMDRNVDFKFINGILEFEMYNTNPKGVLYDGIIDSDDFKIKVDEVMEAFRKILVEKFPKAFKVFTDNNYLFTI